MRAMETLKVKNANNKYTLQYREILEKKVKSNIR